MNISRVKDKELIGQIVDYCLGNQASYGYVPDFFHEHGPLMRALYADGKSYAERFYSILQAVYKQSGHIFSDASVSQGPNIWIHSVDQLDDPKMSDEYFRRAAAIKQRISSGEPVIPVPACQKFAASKIKSSYPDPDSSINEYYLFSGYSLETLIKIMMDGARPDLGSYDAGITGKGFGALGRGAYFTDRIMKALTYAPCPLCQKVLGCTSTCVKVQAAGKTLAVRRLLLSRVVLGHCLGTFERGKYRHSNHNQFVKQQEGEEPVLKNILVNEGSPAPELSAYDSLHGIAAYGPGGSAITAAINQRAFDSDEYLVRNADQILPSYVVNFTVTRQSAGPSVPVEATYSRAKL